MIVLSIFILIAYMIITSLLFFGELMSYLEGRNGLLFKGGIKYALIGSIAWPLVAYKKLRDQLKGKWIIEEKK